MGALVEREESIDDLHDALSRVKRGRGEVALVTGEAGVGKTSVVREFLQHTSGRPRVLLGACDPLIAPRPFGPLIDALSTEAPAVAERIAAGADRAVVFAETLAVLAGARDEPSTVFVIEDAHWADEATLDLVTFLGRRISTIRTLLLVTFREDEVDARHPLRLRLGELGSPVRTRIRLSPLTRAGVAAVAAESAIDPDSLYEMTRGNPFFVTEVIGAGGESLPESVRDAVLARVSRLPPAARDVLDAAAIVPGRIESWLLDAMIDDGDHEEGLDVCVARGLVTVDPMGSVAFRHELARLAIGEALPRGTRRALNARALETLSHPPSGHPDIARLAHHAAEAEDGQAVLVHAPAAAVAASAVGAHHAAVPLLDRALRYRHLLDHADAADLLIAYAHELKAVGRLLEALEVSDQAGQIFADVGDVEAQAMTLAETSALLLTLARQAEADERLGRAADLLDGRDPSPAAALVASYRLSNLMLDRDLSGAGRVGDAAIELAEAVGEAATVAHASIQSGITLAMNGTDEGIERIRRGQAIAREIGRDDLVALGEAQIGSGMGELRRYDLAVPALRIGLEYANEREIVPTSLYLQAWLARCEFELGDWEDASARAGGLLRNPRCTGISRFVALVTISWLRGRRGDPGAIVLADEALDLARSTGHLQRLWPIAVCRAEIAWLAGHLDTELELLDETRAMAHSIDYRPALEEIEHWQCIADGAVRGTVDDAVTPFGLSVAGRHDLAVEGWDRIGCHYEAAMARVELGDGENLLRSYATFEALGARPMANRVGARLREAGVPVPRGPIGSTKENPQGLTNREVDVLSLLGRGRTNREIADELVISPRTVESHVSNVLMKLAVPTRAAAAVEAERLGLTARDAWTKD